MSAAKRIGSKRGPLAGLVLAAMLAACSGGSDAEGPGEMTEGEAAALEDAAEMLDARAEDDNEPAPAPPDAVGNE